ncbi:NERD domain-containing protein [Virgibacillus sp. MSJ-26]|uniref:nuclease-related domain-containing protein n=1 Tax=Virgibacillus sp. MSJ-26 TaxID=2841522 RepID=UPI001C10D303|nr:nuclease-related domain-containing protein [Virgibacillus sp. MSJ-26]MBU5466146.1 NERD domain-containing protein [Virgibacillus sp. MSJ-26]
MEYKPRTKPKELAILEILNKRMNLKTEDKQRYYSLKKGYEGEVHFDSLTKKLQCECLILNDLLLTQNHTTFQLDTTIIGHGKIHLFEIKNNEGDHYYESDSLYNKSGVKLNNPIHQLVRSESLFQQLTYTLGHKYPLEVSVVYINSSFTMYQAPLHLPIIYPTQIKTHLGQLNNTPSKITEQHYNLADKLITLHQTDSRFEQVPDYEYAQLKKGITCFKCNSFLVPTQKMTITCLTCGYSEDFTKAVLRSISEFKKLYPNEKITSSIVYDWCKIVAEQRIRRILLEHFNRVGSHRWTYYE